MKYEMKIKCEAASKTPDDAVVTIKDIMAILGLASYASVQRIDNDGLIKIKRNSQNFRIYSYNDIQLLIKIHKLIKIGVPLRILKTMMEFEKSKQRDPIVFLDEFAQFYKKRYYSANRNKARKNKADADRQSS